MLVDPFRYRLAQRGIRRIGNDLAVGLGLVERDGRTAAESQGKKQ